MSFSSPRVKLGGTNDYVGCTKYIATRNNGRKTDLFYIRSLSPFGRYSPTPMEMTKNLDGIIFTVNLKRNDNFYLKKCYTRPLAVTLSQLCNTTIHSEVEFSFSEIGSDYTDTWHSVKPRLHCDSDSVTVLSSTIRIVQLSRERLFTLGADLCQFFSMIFLKNKPNLMQSFDYYHTFVVVW